MARTATVAEQDIVELEPVATRQAGEDAKITHAVIDPPTSDDATTSPPATSQQQAQLDSRAMWSLLAQHLSSTWGQRCYEFASYLFLIKLFPDTTLQPSIFGFFTTGAAILLAGSVGHLVDLYPRLRFVRGAIIAQKLTVGVSYAMFLIAFLGFAPLYSRGPHRAVLTGLFVLLVILSMDWHLGRCRAGLGDDHRAGRRSCSDPSEYASRGLLGALSAPPADGALLYYSYLRRVDLLSKLLAPLFVSLLTTAVSYTFATAFLLGFAAGSMVFEFIWINLVYRRLPVLAANPRSEQTVRAQNDTESIKSVEPVSRLTETPRDTSTWSTWIGKIRLRLASEYQNWRTFVKNPIFFSSLSISLLYLTVLSFDGSMLAYLKAHSYPDPFVAGMRGVGVVTGLLGTLAMPMLEKRIGLVRTGTWSVFSEVITLIPAVLAFFVITPPTGKRGSPGNDAMLFTGMALSRIGLWSFDLAQLKELQQALDDHPNRNSIMALQFSLQNMLDLVKYIVTMILNRPSEFKWAALISFCAVVAGAACYLIYARKERGHLVHLEWTERLLHKQR
ncbi:hypothetical protein BMF94_0118 [Rhodotorula taiwanensis]|uniref:Solute carrier family 40 member n=1 Tax=Rhodotorula taiwanensis TaxID=741276 RepID=A0A2S5BJC2_9BASI|nr:hypothetical protein BMF94_0118 [Rhodotorula taiwanensis]